MCVCVRVRVYVCVCVSLTGLECEIDVLKAVQKIRNQRYGIVQTDKQYRFVYFAIKHYIETLARRVNAPVCDLYAL